jgi:hypothetical protein
MSLDRLIATTTDNDTSKHDDGANRHFASRAGTASLVDGLPHASFIVHVISLCHRPYSSIS